jgi:hypothetical protein
MPWERAAQQPFHYNWERDLHAIVNKKVLYMIIYYNCEKDIQPTHW